MINCARTCLRAAAADEKNTNLQKRRAYVRVAVYCIRAIARNVTDVEDSSSGISLVTTLLQFCYHAIQSSLELATGNTKTCSDSNNDDSEKHDNDDDLQIYVLALAVHETFAGIVCKYVSSLPTITSMDDDDGHAEQAGHNFYPMAVPLHRKGYNYRVDDQLTLKCIEQDFTKNGGNGKNNHSAHQIMDGDVRQFLKLTVGMNQAAASSLVALQIKLLMDDSSSDNKRWKPIDFDTSFRKRVYANAMSSSFKELLYFVSHVVVPWIGVFQTCPGTIDDTEKTRKESAQALSFATKIYRTLWNAAASMDRKATSIALLALKERGANVRALKESVRTGKTVMMLRIEAISALLLCRPPSFGKSCNSPSTFLLSTTHMTRIIQLSMETACSAGYRAAAMYGQWSKRLDNLSQKISDANHGVIQNFYSNLSDLFHICLQACNERGGCDILAPSYSEFCGKHSAFWSESISRTKASASSQKGERVRALIKYLDGVCESCHGLIQDKCGSSILSLFKWAVLAQYRQLDGRSMDEAFDDINKRCHIFCCSEPEDEVDVARCCRLLSYVKLNSIASELIRDVQTQRQSIDDEAGCIAASMRIIALLIECCSTHLWNRMAWRESFYSYEKLQEMWIREGAEKIGERYQIIMGDSRREQAHEQTIDGLVKILTIYDGICEAKSENEEQLDAFFEETLLKVHCSLLQGGSERISVYAAKVCTIIV